MVVLEKKSRGNCIYQRLQVSSTVLQKQNTVGILRTAEAWEDPSRIQNTIYFFHGGNGDDRQALEAGIPEAFQAVAGTLGVLGSSQVIFPNLGPFFLAGAHRDCFFREWVPSFEEGTRTETGKRMVGGISMGGWSALSLFLEAAIRFDAVGVHYPSIILWNFLNSQEREEYCVRNGLPKEIGALLTQVFAHSFRDHDEFKLHDPIFKLNGLSAADFVGKKIYFDVGDHDDLGLGEGVHELHRRLTRLGITHLFREVPKGKHDLAFVKSEFPFLLKFLL